MSNFTKVWMATTLLLLSHLLSAQTTDPWAIKKQRKNTGQYPTVPYQTRNGQNIQKPNNARRGPLLQLPQSASPSVASLTVQQGPADEPPHEIKGALPASANARRSTDLLGAAQHYLGEVSSLMQVKAPTEEFGVERQWKDAQGKQHLRMQQQYRGVKVYGSEIIVHADATNTVQGLNGRYIASPQALNPVPSVSETGAVSNSLDYFRRQGTLRSLTTEQQRILKYTAPTAELIILPTWETTTPTLAWRVVVRPNFLDYWEVFVDAHSGELISQTNMTCTFAPDIDFSEEDHTEVHRHHHALSAAAAPHELLSPGRGSGTDLNGVNRSLGIWQVGNESALIDASKDMFKSNNATPFNELEGVLITFDAQRVVDAEQFYYIGQVGTTFDDPTAVSAHYNASVAYDYFREKLGRSSIDGNKGNVISIINVVDKDEEGNAVEMDNAYWNGAYMAYGNGNKGFKPLAGGLDVGGHEMSHGVISSTAGLVYRNQSGAINEHIADVFGVIIDEENYTLGETIVLPGVFPSGAMRDMEDPHNGGNSRADLGWQPNHMDEFYSGTADNGGVHINSGIPNRAFYLMAAEFGRDKIGAIYYDALTKYLTASSQFIDLRRAIINSARDLYGDAEVEVVAQAFDVVGITDGNTPGGGGGGDPDPLPDPEEENDDLPVLAKGLLLTVNTDPNDTDENGNEHSLYLVDRDKNAFRPISITPVSRKPSVTDDGNLAFFITDESNINAIELTSPFREEIIDEQGLWENISISRDGSRMAIVTNQKRPEIWVGDLVTGEFMMYELYNPTSQDNIVTYDVQYPDAIEWDYSGEYLLYDAFNQVQTFGATQEENDAIEYWDVNFIKVWDNTADTFGNGEIIKVFSNLPKGISIGNPTFSKTNRNIAAFDLFNAEENTYAIIAADLETGETKTVYENNTIGFPSYSNDDQFLVFDALDGDTPVVGQIALKDNKLEAAGEPTFPYTEAQWTTWFGQGTRVINSPKNDLLSFEVKQGEFTAPGTIEERVIALDVPGTVDVTKMVAKFEQSSGASVYVDDARQYSGLTSNDFSKEVTYSVIAENGDQQDYIVRISQDGTPPPSDPDPDQPDGGDPDPDGPNLPDKPDTGGNNPDEVVSTEEEVAESPLVYPNPFEQDLYLGESLSGQAVELTLHNILGQAIPLEKQGDHFQLTGTVQPGLYMLTIRRGSDTQTVRLVKR